MPHAPARPSGESAKDDRVDHTECGFYRSNRRDCGRVRGQPVRPGPPFSAPRSALCGAHHGAIDAPQFVVDLDVSAKTIEYVLQRAVVVPLIKVIPDRGLGAECGRQITPLRAGVENPQNAIDHVSGIVGRPTCSFGGREQVRDQFPLSVREPMSKHGASFPHA